MASLSLPRVLQLKKNSLDAEREQFEKFQTLAIQKAINAIETPVKEKHVRSTIIGTFQEQSAVTYWMVAIRLPIQDNRIVAWKFCHVTHKLLREGHPACLDDSQRHIGMIENLGKLWVHLREGYGKLVHLYCNLLICKLKFHSRNPRFPGNMLLTADELDAIAENDVNNYFQLCVELFDYMEEILNLQASVFDSLGNARANSMTASGQCRLAALIPCAQDASQIYDCNVRLLFRLHASLPADTLAGHRERFRQQFKKLSSFYKHASSLQYYRNLLTLPVLPSNPPNFLQQSDFGTYVTPVVSIPEPSPDEVDSVASLIDTADTISQAPSDNMEDFEARPSPSPQPDPIVERDRLIDHLQNELKRMRSEVSQLVQERNTMLGSMREHCTRIESQLHTTKAELEEERHRAQILSVQTPEIKQKLTETEEKAKVQDEKFQKLKGAYTQLREEHITLIRQKAEVDKLSTSLRAAAAQHESAKLALQQQLNDRIKDVELLQQSASSSEEIDAYKTEITNLRADVEQARQKEVELETLKASMEALEIEHKTATKEQEEKITTISNELKETTETLERIKQEKEEKETELVRVKEELVGLREKSGDEYKKVVEERDAALSQVEELKQQHSQEKEDINRLNNSIVTELQSEVDRLQQKITICESDYTAKSQDLNQEILNKNEEIKVLVSEKETEINDSLQKLNSLEEELKTKTAEVSDLQAQLNELIEYKKSSTELNTDLVAERKAVADQLKIESDEKVKVLEDSKEKMNFILELQNNLKNLENDKDIEITQLKADLQKIIDDSNDQIETLKRLVAEKDEINEMQMIENDNQIETLKRLLAEKEEINEMQMIENNNQIEALKKNVAEKDEINEVQIIENASLSKRITELTATIEDKKAELAAQTNKLNDTLSIMKENKLEYENRLRDLSDEITILKDRLQGTTESKGEIVDNLKAMITLKDKQVISLNVDKTKLNEELSRIKDEFENAQAAIYSLEQELDLKTTEVSDLQVEIDKLLLYKKTTTELKADLATERKTLTDQLKSELELKKEMQKTIDENNNEIDVLSERITKLTTTVEDKTAEITALNVKLNETLSNLQENKIDYENRLRELNVEVTILKDKLQGTTESKDEIIASLKTMIAEKDEEVIALNVEVTKLTEEMSRINDELEEAQAALEISNNELFTLKEEHETILETNQDNLTLKNQDLRELNEKINEIKNEKFNLQTENNKFRTEKEVLESQISELKQSYESLRKSHDDMKYEKESLAIELNNEIETLKMDYKHLKDDKESETQLLNEKLQSQETYYENQLAQRNEAIGLADANLLKMREELEKLQNLVAQERTDMDVVYSEKHHEKQLLENKIEQMESKRLNAECELQDLLQHNSVLEADLAAAKKQLEDTRKALEKQSSRLVSCAGEAALEVTNEAITAFETANAHDTIMATAELAAKALEQLARHKDVSGNEESVAKSAIVAAHNTAQLSAYVTDVSNISTNIEISEKLNGECRSMLNATKQCLESIKSGSVVSSNCTEAQSLVRAMMTSATAADRSNSGGRSVDDELADMDRAIEEAASQIESMLAATRAGGSGVKLEVNGKILDACTTLMGAVKILVQDARKLQNELGDPKTRQKMYRKNPQWSEGLISAAKAVVFAAKLLVTSADEAVGASGQVEGVSAAAHEVAGSTAQLVAASRARADPESPALARLTHASRHVAAATGAVVAAVKAGSTLVLEQEALDTSALSLTATRRLEMESKVRSLKLETALDAERARLAALRKRHYQLAQMEENGNMENGKD